MAAGFSDHVWSLEGDAGGCGLSTDEARPIQEARGGSGYWPTALFWIILAGMLPLRICPKTRNKCPWKHENATKSLKEWVV
jgi:hypothetical protein